MRETPSHPDFPSFEHGFTLVEVLISLFIFSLISVGAMIALSATLDVRERSQTEIAALDRLSAMRRIMADDFGALVNRESRDGLGSFIDPARASQSGQSANAPILSFIRRGRSNPGGVFARGDLWRVTYRVQDGALIRAFYPHENPAQLSDPIDRVLMNDVEALDVEYLFTEDDRGGITVGGALGPSLAQPLHSIPAIAIDLIHADGTRTQHVFEIAGAAHTNGGING